ncbi:peptide ABC transporter substrate-binding protein [Tissierella creatinini]|nr:peptide ABC transporter substrate-binding protein [Tissierella creatinini]TJX64348.1 peptide ABC transporter substrate-binding protein [Soehngenia saccharolytica]
MSKKLLVLMSLLLVVAIVITGCSTPKPEETPSETPTKGKKILRTNNSSEPGSLDPALAQGTHESWVLENTFEGLMKYDADGKVIPGMAESYKLSEDNLTYTFKIRQDAIWSDGNPVTAHDFEFSWKRALDPNLGAFYAFQLYYIKGAEEYNSTLKPGTYPDPEDDTKTITNPIEPSELEGLDTNGKSEEEINEMVYQKRLAAALENLKIKALDDYTLEVTLVTPTGYFPDLTAFYTYFPVSKTVVEANPEWAKEPETHVSNGPFKLVSWEHNATIDLEKSETYYDTASIKLDGIHFDIIEDENTAWQKYEGGEYDILATLPQAVAAQMAQEKNPELTIGAQVGTYYYNLNNEIKPFTNVKVRKGLAMTLDRQTIVEKIAQGGQIAATGVVPLGLVDETGKEYRETVGSLLDYNVEEGKKLFEEGLQEEGMTIEDFNNSNFVILYNTLEAHKKIAQAAQEMWRSALGINLGLENVEFQVKLDREKAGDFTISRAGWNGDYSDPMTMLDLWWSGSSFNDANYNNPEYDRLILETKATADQTVRFNNMRAAEKILMEDMPVVPIYFYTQPYAVKPNVTGIHKLPLFYPTLAYADIQ